MSLPPCLSGNRNQACVWNNRFSLRDTSLVLTNDTAFFLVAVAFKYNRDSSAFNNGSVVILPYDKKQNSPFVVF